MEQAYIIYESELIELLHDSMMLAALLGGGVDNWEWYGASIHDFIKANNGNPDDDIYDIAKKELENYEEVE